MNSNENIRDFSIDTVQNEPARKKRKAALVLLSVLCVLFGIVLLTLRLLILFSDYDNSICLYPYGALNTAFGVCTASFVLVLIVLSFVFMRGEGKYKINYSSIPLTFSQSLLSFSFAALAFSVIFIAKRAETSLSTFDSVLIALSLVSAVAFFADAFASNETLGIDAGVVLKIFACACCLFITFYFYFDKTTAIHNTNKKLATLAFSAALLAIFYSVKAYVKKTNKAVFVALNLVTVTLCVMYSVPNLVWYFKNSEPLLLNVFFDVVCLSLGILSLSALLSFERAADEVNEQENGECEVGFLSDNEGLTETEAEKETEEENNEVKEEKE